MRLEALSVERRIVEEFEQCAKTKLSRNLGANKRRPRRTMQDDQCE